MYNTRSYGRHKRNDMGKIETMNSNCNCDNNTDNMNIRTFKRSGFIGKLALMALAAVLLLPGVVKAQYGGGSGTAASPYLISTEAHLRTLATNVNNGTSYAGQYFRLTTNISMSSSFVPIGTSYTYPFSGTFWGDGHTISNLTMTNTTTQRQGLFGCVKHGWIDSVIVSGTVAGGDTTGGIVGSLIYGTVKGCTNNCTITGSYRCHGGIVGAMYYGRVINCRNNGTNNNTAAYQHGGIAGFARYASTIRNCVNTGTIGGSSYYHGGIVGQFEGAASAISFADTVGIFNCVNRGSITGSYNTGGIAGRFYYVKHMRGCVNNGTVTGTMYTGGIVGYSYGSTSYHPRFTLCTDSANVTSSSYYVGGILGYGYYIKVDSCMTHGTITSSYSGASYTGGITGYTYYTLVTNCRTDAAAIVQGYTYVGGISGYFYYDTIMNCTNNAIVRGYNSSNQSYRGGIAGYSYGSSTYRLYFENCHNKGSVTGSTYVGGLTSYAYYGTARRCTNSGAISSSGYVGGIVGQNYGYFDVYNSSNHGNITSTGVYTGGIIGYCYSNSTYKYLNYCTNTGHITSSSTNVGGILGYGYYIYVRYNTNSGDVTSTYASGSAYVGGIVGYGSSYTYNQYNLNGGLITAKADYVGGICGYSYGSTYTTYNLNVNRVSGGNYTAAIAGSGAVNTSNNYWDKQMCPTTYVYSTTTTNNATLGRATADFLGVSTYPGTGFTAVAGLYPIPTGLQDSLGAKLAATPVSLQNLEDVKQVSTNFPVSTANGVAWSSNFPTSISISGATATVNGPGLVTLTGQVNGMQKHLFMMVKPPFCGGSGTQADPYLICTPADLDTLAQFVNGGMDFSGEYFRVVNNLNMSGYPNWRIIGASPGTPFMGHFDGNGRTISNLTVSSTANYCGLFGYVKGTSAVRADVHDLVLRGSISGGSYTGAIVGRAEYADITNITNFATVSGNYSYHGGIAGYVTYTNVRRVSNRASVAGSSYVGGLVGYAVNGSYYIENCVNGGAVNATSTYVGGIVGYLSSSYYVQYCANSGTVKTTSTSASSYTGGIAGGAYYYIRYCLNGGLVESGGGYVGGIAGYGSSSTYITYNLNVNNVRGLSNTAAIVGYGSCATTNYWDKQMCPTTLLYQSTANASCAKTTAQLLGQAAIPSTSYFTSTVGLYPMPTNIKDSLITKLAATPINLSNLEDVADVQTNFTVSNANSVVWTNDNTTSISLSGTNATLRMPGINMFSGTVQNMIKNVRIVSEPKFCGGSGTQLDPYIICTANTLDTLAIYTNQGMDFAGRYFLMINDLNLSSFSNWRVIGDNSTTPFKGHFDGGGHTISNLTITGTSNYRGLFGYVLGLSDNDKAEIHHLTVRGSVSGGSNTGGIVGYCDRTRLYNLKNYATVATTSYSNHGGIAGEAYYYCDFDSCENHADIQGSSYTGGIAGYCDYYDKFRDCHNYGDITGSSYSGGIAGRNYYYGLFRNCTNTGDVSGSSNTGGICGYPYYYDTIRNCHNTGDITTSASYVGGIAGYKYYYGYIDSCTNSGNVTGSSYLGGITGYMGCYQFLTNCQNSGDITSTSCYVGGIIGYFSGNSTDSNSIYKIENCPNTGNVSGTYAVGGIAGYTYYCRTRNCDNRGDVTGTSYQVGGIAGYNYYYSIISYCNNYGDVTSSSTSTSYTSSSAGVGGIAGASYYGTAANVVSIHHCNNYGNVSSTGYTTGGIVGMNYYYGHCKYNFNHGNVTGTYYVGGVCGMMYNTTNTTELNDGHIIDCGNSGDVTGTYYVGGVIGRNGYTSGYYYYTVGCVNTGRVTGDYYVGGIAGYNYGYNSSTYRSVVRGCLNAGIVTANTNYAGGICGYTYSSSYAIQEYNLNVGNVVSPGTYKGGVDGYSYAPTSGYFDTLMCPVQYYYYGSSATTTTGKRTSVLTDGSFNPSATYFTAQSGLYPRPTAIANHPMTLLAATPVFLDETVTPLNTVNNVTTCYTVGTRNNVSWSSDAPTVSTITGSDGSILSRGSAVLTAVKDTVITKDVDIEVTALPNFNTFTYPAINDTIGHPISGIRPSLSSGCTFFSNDLPDGLTINASTGEISGTVLDTLNTTFTVISSCTGCRMYQATVSIHIVPDITCAGYTVTLPAGETWYYDREFTQPVGGNTAVVNNNTTFYARGLSGSVSTDFNYTGTVQQYRVPAGADSLKFQVWGAQGGWRSTATYGGKGGYSEGTLTNLSGLSTLYVYVGGSGNSQTTMTSSIYPGGWNGGGYRYSYKGGGGATDISLQGTAGSATWNSTNHLYSRIIVAGGGGSDGASNKMGMYGGGLTGGSSTESYTSVSDYGGKGGTQTYSGYSAAYTIATQTTTGLNANTTANYAGGFGFGGGGVYYSSGYGGAGGGGWYGGSGNVPDGSGDDDRGGGGGSGYVYTAASASNYPSGCLLNSNQYLTNARTIDGSTSFESPTGGTETGHEGDGFARISAYYSQCKYYIVNTLPRVTARISGDTTICNGTATLTLHFTGGAPYRYRITGDNADRTANSDLVTIQVSPSTSTLYYVTFAKSTVTGCEAVPDDLTGIGIVEVCGSSVLCAGDSLTLPSGYTWYTDSRLSNQIPGGIVYPRQNTTYYRSGASYNVVVLDRGTATILDTVYNICSDSTAEVIINFTGLPPFTYRVTGDRTDRVTNSNTVRVPVTTDTSAIVKVTYFSDLNSRCSGVITHSHAEIILCDQPIICYGDTVWLPAGKWYYDFRKTRPVTTPFIVPDQTIILYQSVNDTTDFDYTGNVQEYVVPAGVDTVIMHVWGAQGGGEFAAQYWGTGGKGGYATGSMAISPGTTLYVVVGQEGFQSATTQAYNGGGYGNLNTSSYGNGGTGGGATHIATASGILSSLSSNTSAVKIVAGGGGGAGGCTSPSYSTYAYNGGAGGGLNGIDGLGYSSTSRVGGGGGSQTAGGTSYAGSYPPLVQSGFGQGACVNDYTGDIIQGGGGGGGYYGGGCGFQNGGGGGGGSSYIAGLANASTIAGNASFPSPSGTAETGHEGDGYARIIARGSREFTILVLDNTVAIMTDTTLNICNNQSADLEINFQGTPPFVYRITGDTADRICNTHQAHVTVSPTVTTNYQVTYVAGDVCEGKTSSTYTTVMVCDQPIICAGDTAYLPSGSTWYYDPNMSQAVADTFVTPVVTTTYYGNNNATFTVTVNPVATAQILADTFNICDSTAVLEFYFTGTTPFYYRISGDTTDRVAYSDTVRMRVAPDTSTQYHITAFRDVYCDGTFNNDVATVLICEQPIICKGDTVWLDPSMLWFRDSTLLDTIKTGFVVPTQTTTYYKGGGSGGDTLNFRYTGSVQTYTIPRRVDSVFIQVWGAQGGDVINGYSGYSWYGGKGGYSEGKMAVNTGDVLNVYVGGKGGSGTSGTGQNRGGWNGGGDGGNNTTTSYFTAGAGGGASDVRVNSTSLNARVIVAGAGGGAAYGASSSTTVGGNGGGTSGTQGTANSSYLTRRGSPGTQNAGGARGAYSTDGTNGSFGTGGTGGGTSGSGGGGGAGWYGGGGGNMGSPYSGAGAGGSGFVYTTANADCQLLSYYYLSDALTIAGDMSFPDTTFTGAMESGHEGDGYVRIFTIGPLTQKYRVTVKPSYSDTIRQTICAGASFTHNDSVYTVQGTYYQYFESYDHCDSIEVIELTVNDTLRDTMRVEICAGITLDTNGHLGCVPVNGQQYAPYWIQGVYTQYLRDTVTGCYQNFVIDLTVSDTIRDTVWHTICPSGHYIHNNITYRDTGTFRQALKTPQGCDSILAIVIDRSDTLRETIYRNMCKGSYFPLNGYTYTDTGTYKQPLSNADGCDSILTIVLTYSDTLRDTIHPIICAGDTFIHNGIKYYQTGLSNQYFVSRFGCDSLIYIDLTVRDTIFEHVYDTICAGASVTYNGETFTLPGEYHQILQAAVNCDSFLTIHVHVNDTIRDTIYDTVCAGQTITVNNQTYWIEGEYKQWLRDAGTDCFHNYVIYLEVNDTIRDTIEPWICAGQVFRWNRVPYSVAGWYRQEFRTQEGCDSILHIHLIVGDTLRDTVYFSVCSGHTLTHNNVTYDSTGWYRQNLKNFDDCDSILHIHLTIEDTIRGHYYDTICYGDTYNFNGSDYYIPGIYPYVTRTMEGCDSIAYLHLHVNDTIITHVYDTICRDAQYYYLDTAYDQTGEYYHLLHRTTGCDSTVVLHLYERDSIQSVHYDTICNNTTFRYYGQLLARTGRYPYRHTSVLTGCDSVEWLALTVLDYPVLSIIDSGSYCEGGHATLKANTTGNYITWTSSPYDPTMNGQDHNFTIYVSPDRYTEYTATVDIRPYNCRSTDVHAVNKPAKVEARMSMSPEEITAENLQCSFTDVSIGTIMYREWLFHERVPTIPDKQFFGERTVNYTSSIENDTLEVRLIVVNDEGCYDTAINLYPVFRGDVWVPNAFTPGRIGANRLLKVGHYNLIEYEIFIYTREGLLVFHSDDPEISWDGTYNYKDCKSGSYVYVVHYRTKSRPSESYEKKGSVLLIR